MYHSLSLFFYQTTLLFPWNLLSSCIVFPFHFHVPCGYGSCTLGFYMQDLISVPLSQKQTSQTRVHIVAQTLILAGLWDSLVILYYDPSDSFSRTFSFLIIFLSGI